jgi:hypothetical protein
MNLRDSNKNITTKPFAPQRMAVDQDSKDGIKFLVLTQNSFLVAWCLGGKKVFC